MPSTDSTEYSPTLVPTTGSSLWSVTATLRAVPDRGQLARYPRHRPNIMDSSLLRKGTAGCLTVLALGVLGVPAALADPPVNDNYLSSLRLNDPGSRLDRTNTLVDRRDTTQATSQADIFAPPRSGGPAEPAACAGSGYGHTAWYDFYPDESGVVRVRASGYDAVVSV